MAIRWLIAYDSSRKWDKDNDFHEKIKESYKQVALTLESAVAVSTNELSSMNTGNIRVYDINGIAVITGKRFDCDCVMIGTEEKIDATKQELRDRTGYDLCPCPW